MLVVQKRLDRPKLLVAFRLVKKKYIGEVTQIVNGWSVC